MRNTIHWSLVTLLITSSTVFGQFPPQDPTPLPQGQEIVARDGDRVIIEDDARVGIVRRRQAAVRTVFNSAERFLMVLIDYPLKPSDTPDGRVDIGYTYYEVQGEWPLGERWEGFAGVEEYSLVSQPGPRGFGLLTPLGLVQLFPVGPPNLQQPRDSSSAIAALSFRGGGGGGVGMSFDQAEQQLAQMTRPGSTGGIFFGTNSGVIGGIVPGIAAEGAVRGGANVGPPMKIHDVPAVYPEAARQAGIRGVVILEVTIGEDGSVANARVLRSIPLLDAAALEAVRQWRYQPMVVNDKAVPVIITVTVAFPPNVAG